MPLTHRELCDLAVKWLQRPASRSGPGCQVAFSECRGDWKGETPDAIGFRAAVFKEASVLVEVKVNRSDFLADRKKPYRIDPTIGMGTYRYFMAPAGLISPDELPARWGLIEVGDRYALNVVRGHVLLKYRDEDNWRHEAALNTEWTLLVRMLNRVGDVEKAQGYLKEANNRNAALVRENNALRTENDRLRLVGHLPGQIPAADDMPIARARPKLQDSSAQNGLAGKTVNPGVTPASEPA
jgi:hypothetical protein